ncbi:ATP synthase F1 subunit epsilon [Candidatus Bipolaricaulota bacterium]|nr:ATP synthase F1 subunit epsilon [Candidatus Bipolaricaulota bacterium]
MQFKLLTPDQEVFSGEVTLVGGRTDNGSFSLLPRHVPAVMELEPAALKVEGREGTSRFVVHGGFLFKERDDTVRVLTREARDFDDIDPEELGDRIDELEEKLDKMDKEKERAEYEKARSELERAKLNKGLVGNE